MLDGTTTREGPNVNQPQLTWIANYIWGIADDVLRDLYKRGEYRDLILPTAVLRRWTPSWSLRRRQYSR